MKSALLIILLSALFVGLLTVFGIILGAVFGNVTFTTACIGLGAAGIANVLLFDVISRLIKQRPASGPSSPRTR